MTTDEINKSKKSKNPIGSAITSLFARLTGSNLTGAEREANEYSSAEADKARAWNEKMYLQYESPQGQVNQLKAAGLNPALMYGSAPSGSVDPVSSPESVSPGSGLDLFSAIANMVSLKANIDRTKAEIRNLDSRTHGQDIENQFKPAIFEQNLRKGEIDIENTLQGIRESMSRLSLNGANIQRIASDIALNSEQVNNLRSQISLRDAEIATEYLRQANIEASTENIVAATALARADIILRGAQTALVNAQTANTAESTQAISLENWNRELDNAIRDATGIKPGQDIWKTASDLINNSIGAGTTLFQRLIGSDISIKSIFNRNE